MCRREPAAAGGQIRPTGGGVRESVRPIAAGRQTGFARALRLAYGKRLLPRPQRRLQSPHESAFFMTTDAF
ncbi:hypothetical protein Busp01_21560 [Trinickia caryophylli]|nr:hypothetical protein C0Z17_16035 [Trinickia caryophylli]GLU32314.1 hypothetical protein Busp01_21560 [Trinickia caryophylli]